MSIDKKIIPARQVEFGFVQRKNATAEGILKKYPDLDIAVEEKVQEYKKNNMVIDGKNINAFVAGVILNYGNQRKNEVGRNLESQGAQNDIYQDIKEKIILLMKEMDFAPSLAEGKALMPEKEIRSSQTAKKPHRPEGAKHWLNEWEEKEENKPPRVLGN